MSAAAAAAPEAGDAPAKKRRTFFSKKLVLMLAAAALLLAVAGGGAIVYFKKKAAATAAAEGDEETAQVADEHKTVVKRDPKDVPTFLPLDPFTVNLADKDQERYAQVSITLEVDDAKFAEQLKAYMPAVRNAVLMILAHKSSTELLERAGKEQLAAEIMRETVRPLGLEIEAPAAPASGAAKTKQNQQADVVHNPVRHVHFSNFIIQ